MFVKKDELRYISGCVRPEELSGVKKESFILPYAGGEIWFEHLDGIYQYTRLAIQKLRKDSQNVNPSGVSKRGLTESACRDKITSLFNNGVIYSEGRKSNAPDQ